MPAVSAVFWDVGGVVLNNAWDHVERRDVLDRLGLDAADFESRHAPLFEPFERGELSLDEYLDATVFFRRRAFSRERFKSLMRAQSKKHPAALALARRLKSAGRCFTATLNNESRDLNDSRIERFGLRQAFEVFFSSCYLGTRKPGSEIFEKTLALSQRKPRECFFVDDREENLAAPRRLGMKVHLYKEAAALETVFRGLKLLG